MDSHVDCHFERSEKSVVSRVKTDFSGLKAFGMTNKFICIEGKH